jgi:trehalose-6-phosphatase
MMYPAARHDIPPLAAPNVRVLPRQTPAPPAQSIDHVFEVLDGAPRRLLIVNHDGTLAPFEFERVQAELFLGVRELLKRIRQELATRVAFINGRPAREMRDLLMLSQRPEIWGVHGCRRMMASGQLLRSILPPQVKAAFARFRALQPQFEEAGALV